MKGLYHILLPEYIGIYVVTSIVYSQGSKGYIVYLSAPSENNSKYHTDLVYSYKDKLNMI